MKISRQKKQKNVNWIQLVTLLPVTFSRTCIWWCYLHIHVLRQHEQHVHNRFLTIWPTTDILLVFIFFCANPFLNTLFGSMGKCSIQYVWYISLSGILWTSTCLLIHKGVVNKRLSHFFYKNSENYHLFWGNIPSPYVH